MYKITRFKSTFLKVLIFPDEQSRERSDYCGPLGFRTKSALNPKGSPVQLRRTGPPGWEAPLKENSTLASEKFRGSINFQKMTKM